MKPARIIVLVIAIVAGGIAALLAGRSDAPPPAPAPVVQLDTTDVLVAGSDIGLGNAVQEKDLRWQTWPAAAAAGTSPASCSSSCCASRASVSRPRAASATARP